MKSVKGLMHHIFVEGLSGMATGLFATLIIGTIAGQIGDFVGGTIGGQIVAISTVATCRYKASPLVTLSAATSGMVGAFASKILAGSLIQEGVLTIAPPGEPLGAFIAAVVAIEVGSLVAGKTKVDILVTPFVAIGAGGYVGLLVGPPISKLMAKLGELVNMGAHNHPLVMGIVVSVVMGMVLTLPISSAALGIILDLGGIAAGAATVGCCAQMVGFAVASYKENGLGGLLAQGLGTSMVQVPNIVKKPVIWIPPIVASAILGPIATCVLEMTGNAIGSGMGTSGLVGPIMSYQTMTGSGVASAVVVVEIIVMYVVAPAVISLGIAQMMRRWGWIKDGDMKLEV